MKVSRDDLNHAVQSTGLSPEQADALWLALNRRRQENGQPRFDPAHVAYYLGALIVIGAMGWYVTAAWDSLAGWQLTLVAAFYAVCFLIAGSRVWQRPGMRIAGGLLLTIAVCMIPLAVFGVEKSTGLWPDHNPGSYTRFHPYLDGSWIIMEIATVLAGLLALRRWSFPFLTAPIAHALWFLSMDLPALLFRNEPYSWDEKKFISMLFGLVMIGGAYLADLRGRKDIDFAFWGYLYGLAAFWGGLSAMDSDSELGKAVYCLINLGLIATALILRRKVFMVFGVLGVMGYLWHLCESVFKDSLAFPVVLSGIGIAVIALGVQYQRHHARIELRLAALLPSGVKRLLPPSARE